MSALNVVATIRAALEALLSAKIAALNGTVRTDIAYTEWETPTRSIRPTSAPNLQVSARRWVAPIRGPGPTRLSRAQVEIVYRYFSSATETATIALNVNVVALAVAQVLDELREYSDANGGTVQLVESTLDYALGQLPGGNDRATVNGFSLVFTVLERAQL